jgi:acetyl esterase/lipase
VRSEQSIGKQTHLEARKAGAPITLELWQGMHHVFQLDMKTLASSRRALERAATFLR